jgi:hypothetical protein
MVVVHVDCPHGADPMIHPWFGEIHDMDCALNPVGRADGRARLTGAAPTAAGPDATTIARAARHSETASGDQRRRIGTSSGDPADFGRPFRPA